MCVCVCVCLSVCVRLSECVCVLTVYLLFVFEECVVFTQTQVTAVQIVSAETKQHFMSASLVDYVFFELIKQVPKSV